VASDPSGRPISQSADRPERLAWVRAMYYVVLTIPLAQYDLFLKKVYPSSRAYEVLVNGCFDQDSSDGCVERKIQVLCSKDEAVTLLHIAEELCPKIIPKISRDWPTI
jgi:hypothetical protein